MRIVTLIVASLVVAPAVASNVYKWKDANGQMHYTQTPPPSGAVRAKPPETLQPGVSLQAPAKPVTPPAAAAAPVAAVPAAETKEAKAKRCTESKERLAFLEERTARRLMITQPDGSESRMTEEEFDSRVAKAKAAGNGC